LVLQGKGIRGVFVGTGPLDGYLRNIARDRNLPIELRGALPHAAVLEEMKAAAIFCMPSTQAADGDNEGLGLVFLEAQMLGVPVVAFRQGPVPEAVIDGETGLLATDRDAQDLARALATLLDDPDLRQRMGHNGQKFVRATFDLTQQAGRLEDIYDAVLRERAAPAGLGQAALKNH
jgi:glycosyltransferase involved in cell wall biosynthesis